MERDKKAELLSPAGNEEGFYGAVHAGADAVYLAGDRFGARAYADNFTTESLLACIRYAHLLGRRVYLAVNTLLKDRELSELYGYLSPFYKAGLDAVIVQDLGVLRFIREHFPKLKVHVSTQMTLCSSYGAALLKAMGASRIVPARELGLQELSAMRQNADIEVESFIHGAMCYCYSGQCLFSSILGGRSGNRGRCAQPCRLPYSVSVGDFLQKECYPLSLKDMCTIEHIPKLVEAGIDSFKIEGRMKKPEYTAGVTAIYRRYIDLYYKLRETRGAEGAAAAYRVDKADMEHLESLYIRSGIQDGYYFRRNGREMITLDSPAYSGSNEKLLAEIREKHINVREKLPVSVRAVFRVGQPAEATFTWEGRCSHIEGSIVERAGKQPITPENIRKQLGKLGDSIFRVTDMEILADQDSFYPLKQMNELRRAAVAGLEEQILSEGGFSDVCQEMHGASETINPRKVSGGKAASKSAAKKCHVISICTLPQLKAAADWFSGEKLEGTLRFYIDGDLFLGRRQEVLDICNTMPAESSFYLALPYILRESDRHYLEKLSVSMRESGIFRGFLVRSMDGLGFVRGLMEEGRSLEEGRSMEERLSMEEWRSGEEGISVEGNGKLYCRTDAGVYAWNQWSVQELARYVEGFCLPYELNGSEQRDLPESFPCEKIVYGRIPMMITANCLFRTFRQCRKYDNANQTEKQRNNDKVNLGAILRNNDKVNQKAILRNNNKANLETKLRNNDKVNQEAILRNNDKANPEVKWRNNNAGPATESRDNGKHGRMNRETKEHLQASRGESGSPLYGKPGEPEGRSLAMLRDRYRNEFPVIANCRHCMNIIYNKVPLSLCQALPKWEGRADLRMDFTLESPEEVAAILDCFLKGAPFPLKEYTAGHEKRGVE